MAAAPADPLDVVRRAIKGLRPDRPNLAAHFRDEELQKLYDAGYRSVEDLGDASRQALKDVGLQLARIDNLTSGMVEGIPTDDNAIRMAHIAILCIRINSVLQPDVFSSGAQLGRTIKELPSFRIAAPASRLLPLPAAEQWTAFFDELSKIGVSEQPDGREWVDSMYARELDASQGAKAQTDHGYAARTPPSAFKTDLGPREKVQLAVGCLLRVLGSAKMLQMDWRETSRCGIPHSRYKPDFAGFATSAEAWASLGMVMQVRDVLSWEEMEQALGKIAQRLEAQFVAQPNRQKAFAVAVGRDSVDIVIARKLESGIVLYEHSGMQELSLNRESAGLQHLVATVSASAQASGYRAMTPPKHRPQHSEYFGPCMPLKYSVSQQSVHTEVYEVNLKKHGESSQGEPAILKICPSLLIGTEVRNLARLKQLGVDEGCTRVVESGPLPEGLSYLLSQPVGRPLRQDEDAKSLIQLGEGLVKVVERWHLCGLHHGDLSVSNVGWLSDGIALIWDLSSMAHDSDESPAAHLTATVPYMAISVEQAAAPTLSSELESIFYILTALSSEDGMLYWQTSAPWYAESKVAAMMTESIYHKKVRKRTREELRPLVDALHKLFFPLESQNTSLPPRRLLTGCLYRTDVSAEEFLQALSVMRS